MRRLLLTVVTLGLLLAGQAFAEPITLNAEQKARLQQLLPNTRIDANLLQGLADLFYSHDMPVTVRLKAISTLAGLDRMPPSTALHRKICIWDIGGRAGPVYQAAIEQRAIALQYGVHLKMVPFTNETILVEELKAGHCDAALMSGLRARSFNLYTGTVDAIGAIPDNQQMHTLLRVLADPSQAGRMVQGQYVIMGIYPAGSAYIFVDDKRISSLNRAAGKKVAVLNSDPMQAEMVAGIGATPVPTDFVNAPNMFNNHVVDILPAPLVTYEYLELYKGMTPNGGIVDYPFTQLTMQLVGRLDKFPNVIAQLIREASLQAYGRIRQRLKTEEDRVPDHWWIHISDADKKKYDIMMRKARENLKDKGYYSADMLDLEHRIRCKYDPARAECASHQE